MPVMGRIKRISTIKPDIASFFITGYAILVLVLSFWLPVHLTGTAAILIVLIAGLKWGLLGGIISAVFSSYAMIVSFKFFNFEIMYIITAFIVYFAIGIIIGKSRDVFKKQQSDIKKSEEKYKAIVENTNDALYVTDFRGTIIEVNETACRMLGYESHELVGSSILKIVAPEETDILHDWMMDLLNSGSVVFECRHVRKDGSEVPVESSVVLVSNEGDGIMQSFVRDISERKRAEKELQRSHRLVTVLNSIDAFIYVLDTETDEILFINDYGKKVWGDKTGKESDHILQKNTDGPCELCTINKLVGDDGTFRGVYEWEYYNGLHNKWYLCREQVIRWLDGRLVRIQVARDITEHKHWEGLLLQSRERLFTVLNSIDSLIYVVDIETNELLFINEPAREEWGNIVGKICWQAIKKYQQGPCSYCPIHKLTDEYGNSTGAYKWERYDSTSNRWYEYQNRSFNWVGNRVACLVIISDITERKNNEEERYRIRLYGALEEERTRLAQDLHDEVGMALTVVKLELQMLEKQYFHKDNELKERIKKSLDIINSSQKQVRNKSAYLRPPALDDLGLIPVLKNMTEEVSDQANIKIILNTTDDKADFSKELDTVLYRCIQEALTNVMKHSSAETVIIDVYWNDREVSVKIKDDGMGFDVDKLSFSEEKMGIRGIKERVFLMRGAVNIDSAPGKGTSIHITIPLNYIEKI